MTVFNTVKHGFQEKTLTFFQMLQNCPVDRDNQIFIGLRLDPELLAAVDKKRAHNRLSRSQFIRDAIFEAVRDMGLSQELVTPADRVGVKKGGRKPKAPALSVEASEEKQEKARA